MQTFFSQSAPDTLSFIHQYKAGVKYIIKTSVGSSYAGFVRDETKYEITVENKENHTSSTLKKNQIMSARALNGRQNYEEVMLDENYHANNYLFATSAFLFKEGEGNYNSHWFLLETIDYALSENWGVTANTLAFLPFTFGVKCAYQVGDLNYVGGNVFLAFNMSSGNSGSGFFGYGAFGKITHGTSNNNFTIAGGLLGLNSDLLNTVQRTPFVNMPFVNAAYCNRFSRQLAFTMEGWYLPQVDVGLGGVGLKLVANEFVCWSFGCYTFLNASNGSLQVNVKAVPIPYFGLSRRFY